jgi:thiamine pyrophosphokinase
LLVAYNAEGKYEFVPDYFVGDAYFGGYYNESDKTYRFNISRYIQQLADQSRTDYGLALIIADNRASANRIILKSPTHTNGMKLSITYLKP